jgi:hypothetical protein
MATTIINYSESGAVDFLSTTNRHLTEEECRAECEAWAADYDKAVIIYKD